LTSKEKFNLIPWNFNNKASILTQ